MTTSNLKILFFDLETIAKPFTTSRERIRSEDTAVCSFLYAWGDKGKVQSIDLSAFPADFKKDPFNDKKLLQAAAKVILEADVLVAHYGSGFDKPILRTRFILSGLDDAAQHMQRTKLIDTCIMARQIYRVNSSSLRYLAKLLRLTPKLESKNDFWVGVMRSNMKAMKDMTRYGKGDVVTLRELYMHERKFAPNHPNFAFGQKDGCPVCTSKWIIILKKPWFQGKTVYDTKKCRKCSSVFRGAKKKEQI